MNRVVLSLGLVWQLASMFAPRILTLIAALFLGGMMAWSQDSTQVQYRYPSGAVSSEGWLVNGIPEGYWRSFYADGTWKSEGNRLRGELEGEWVFYDEAGRVQTTLNYVGGQKNGEEIRWDSTGVQRRIMPWTLDALQGEERVLDERGTLVETIPWDNGKREGVALGFATDANQERGRIIRRMGYRNDLLRWVEEVNRYDDQGRKTGKWLTFWSNGRIREEGPWERGLKEGVFKRFSRQGDLEGTETWHRGELVEDAPEAVALDLRKAFHPNGEVSRSGPWREDTPMGTHRFLTNGGTWWRLRCFGKGCSQQQAVWIRWAGELGIGLSSGPMVRSGLLDLTRKAFGRANGCSIPGMGGSSKRVDTALDSGMAAGFGITWMAACTAMNSTGKAGRTATLWNGPPKEMCWPRACTSGDGSRAIGWSMSTTIVEKELMWMANGMANGSISMRKATLSLKGRMWLAFPPVSMWRIGRREFASGSDPTRVAFAMAIGDISTVREASA